jgi:hypothetical protein
MGFREEVAEMAVGRLRDDPVWRKLAEASAAGGEVRISGDLSGAR